MKRLWMILIAVAVCLTGCQEEKTAKEIIRPVRYETVTKAGSKRSLTFSGVSKSGTQAKLSFRVSGTLTSVRVKVGDKVKKGSLIATIDASDAQLQLEQAQVSLENSRITMETALSNLNRIRNLYENNNVSLSDYESAKTNHSSAKAAYDADKRSVDLQKRALSYYRLTSPMDGIVTVVDADPNENVSTGEMIAELNAGDELEVEVGIPESYISKIHSGADVAVTFPSFGDETFEGVISEVAFAANPETSTFPVTVKLKNPSENIRPGMPAEVQFQLNTAAANGADGSGGAPVDVLIVPVHAVAEDQAGRFVFVVTPAEEGFGTVTRRNVTVGTMMDDGFQILDGLNEGELLVTAGVGKIRDGLKVRLLK